MPCNKYQQPSWRCWSVAAQSQQSSMGSMFTDRQRVDYAAGWCKLPRFGFLQSTRATLEVAHRRMLLKAPNKCKSLPLPLMAFQPIYRIHCSLCSTQLHDWSSVHGCLTISCCNSTIPNGCGSRGESSTNQLYWPSTAYMALPFVLSVRPPGGLQRTSTASATNLIVLVPSTLWKTAGDWISLWQLLKSGTACWQL